MIDTMLQAQDLVRFLNRGITAYHAVDEVRNRLIDNGYQELSEADEWKLQAGGRYYVIRRGSGLIAWIQGDESGIRMIGAHTDSPGLHLKPKAAYGKSGYIQLGVEVYGGPLLATWTDRDLILAGRVILDADGKLATRPVVLDQPILKIPQLAIHLNREVNSKGLLLDKQQHLPPIMGLAETDQEIDNQLIVNLLADHLKVEDSRIKGWTLELVDTQEAVLGGLDDSLIYSGRIDNLAMCHAALQALLGQSQIPEQTSLIALFDSEEIGSGTLNGAASPFIRDTFTRISRSHGANGDALERCIARSFCISADGAHAVHPNYAEFHDAQHPIQLNAGPVIKVNASQRYATTGETAAVFRMLCETVGSPVQEYVHRTDLPCGSTIGPITATNLGLRVVDVGNAMLAMHSIRETAGALDHGMMIRVLDQFFKHPGPIQV